MSKGTSPKIIRDWKEEWVDRMGLIVALGGDARFRMLNRFKSDMQTLSTEQRRELNECLRMRFTPSNGDDGCQSATAAVREATTPRKTMSKEIEPGFTVRDLIISWRGVPPNVRL